jgi:SAM-dependent methyltransferase
MPDKFRQLCDIILLPEDVVGEFLNKRQTRNKVDNEFGKSTSLLPAKRSKLVVSPSPRTSSVLGEGDSGIDCHVAKVPRNDSRHAKFDLQWDDGNIFPELLYPDADFLLQRMNEATLEAVNPMSGEMILDIGCGRGIEGVEFAKRGALVIGLEPSPIMINHAGNHISKNGANMSLIRGIAESLPFQAQTADKAVCKGALDHFPEPALVMEQMAEVLKPQGRAIIAIANFESLGFKLGRAIWWLRKRLGFRLPEDRMPWEIPEDHTYSFDYLFLKHLVDNYFEVEKISGVSLLFGLPWWGLFLSRLPGNISLVILKSLDKVSRHMPRLSDIIIMRCGVIDRRLQR